MKITHLNDWGRGRSKQFKPRTPMMFFFVTCYNILVCIIKNGNQSFVQYILKCQKLFNGRHKRETALDPFKT